MTQSPRVDDEIHPKHPPIVPIPQNPFIPKGRLQRLVNLFPAGQFVRYLCMGVFNTFFGYISFAVALTLLNAILPARLLYLTVILASILPTPLTITVAYFCYKFLVFRTKGNYLSEWLKCFAVYGTSMIPGLVALSALTRFLQSMIHNHAASLHVVLSTLERHLSGRPLAFVQHFATGKAIAGYIAGAIVIGVSTIYSFVGHKKVTFRTKEAA
ncbi:MAG TPA: GtrA family protein [Edaphobacter sp.]|jgi:putative flippase GtrA|nr:GtrA family protein [Edaphobacter sp.]